METTSESNQCEGTPIQSRKATQEQKSAESKATGAAHSSRSLKKPERLQQEAAKEVAESKAKARQQKKAEDSSQDHRRGREYEQTNSP